MNKCLKMAVKFSLTILVALLQSCAASQVQLPMNMAEQIKTSNYKLNKFDADMIVAMSKDEVGLRYMAAVNDLKLQLDIGEAYEKNLLDVMGLMFASTKRTDNVSEAVETIGQKDTYILKVTFELTRVILPRTRFGNTQAHMVISYTLLNSNKNKLFTFTDYEAGVKSNLSTLSDAAVFAAFPLFGAFMQGEKGVVSSAMEYNMKSSIIKITDILQQYLDPAKREAVLNTVAKNEKTLAETAAPFVEQIENGDIASLLAAIRGMKNNYPVLAKAQDPIAQELTKLSEQELDGQSAAAAKEMCAILSETGNSKFLHILENIGANARDKRMRGWGKSYHDALLESLCGTGKCSESKPKTS